MSDDEIDRAALLSRRQCLARHWWVAAFAAAALAVSCGGNEASPPGESNAAREPELPPGEAGEEASVEGPGEEAADDDSPGAADAPSPRASEEELRRVRDAIREGRRATRAGNVADARAAFDRALGLHPTDASLHCEAGFAAVGGADDDRAYAREHLVRGVALFGPGRPAPAFVRPLAMCLYNRGLLAERESRLELARASYERSLSLRESSLVREHLDAVLEGHPVYGELEEFGSTEELPEDPQWRVNRVLPGSGERPEVQRSRSFGTRTETTRSRCSRSASGPATAPW